VTLIEVVPILRQRWKEPLSTEELAHRIVTLFLDLHDRANKGRIDFMHL
jgi:hypothetical protein